MLRYAQAARASNTADTAVLVDVADSHRHMHVSVELLAREVAFLQQALGLRLR